MKKLIKNLDQLQVFVGDLLDGLIPIDTATIIALSGDLGAGKTAFTKSAAKYFNITDDVTSPTFVIQKEYDISDHNIFKKMIHIDAYRLENKTELEYLKWHETIAEPKNIIFIEWPEQVEGIDMSHAIHIYISISESESRIIEIKKPE